MPLLLATITAGEAKGKGNSMKNSSLVTAKYCRQALSIPPMICLLLLTGCSGIDGTTEKPRVTANLMTGHVGSGQEEPGKQPVNPEPSYEWFY